MVRVDSLVLSKSTLESCGSVQVSTLALVRPYAVPNELEFALLTLMASVTKNW
jgi:hypothetical protein